jgi:hypothetical protein
MKEVDEVLSSEQKKKEYFSQKIFKFKFVWVWGSLRFMNEWKFTISSLENPYVETKNKEIALMLLESKKFKIIK